MSKREVRFVTPYAVTAKDGKFWRAKIDGEWVTAPYLLGEYARLTSLIKAARAKRAKERK